MITFAKPRVDRKTMVTIALLLAATCVACYLLAPLSRTLTGWLPFASTIYGDTPRSTTADAGPPLALAVGNPSANVKSPAHAPAPASTTVPPSNATPPVATVTPSGAGTGTRGRSTTASASVVAPALPVPASTPASGPASGPTTASPTLTASTAPAASTFTAHAVDARPPSRLLFAASSPALQAQTLSCASTQTHCAGLQKYGTTASCAYPAFQPVGPIAGVGYAMWEYAPGACYYAIGTQ
jgi:hypothetical protein